MTEGCNCPSYGLVDGTRHGLHCPYGGRLAKAQAEERRLEEERGEYAPEGWQGVPSPMPGRGGDARTHGDTGVVRLTYEEAEGLLTRHHHEDSDGDCATCKAINKLRYFLGDASSGGGR